jgi:hypothetical protein
MPRYDLDLVKAAARGRWSDIIQRLGSVSGDLLDGRHHGCPKNCGSDGGGKDRFRALDDFDDTGAVLCNQCFSHKNGDGFAALMWLTGEDFGRVIERVAKFVGVKAEKARKELGPADLLEWLPWNRIGASIWCDKKPPIQVEALERLGARCAKYRREHLVITIPVWGPQLDEVEPVGWILYHRNGKLLPKLGKGKEIEWKKVLLAPGSQPGLVACLDDWKKIGSESAPHTWWKLEGSTDLLSPMSVDWPSGHAFFTTANGAKEKPADWILAALEGCKVYVCHDADRPGQEGATWVEQGNAKRAGWCPALAELSASVRNVCLPFQIEATHGPDIRDYLGGGGTAERLIEIAEQAEEWANKSIDTQEQGVFVLDNEADQGVRLRALTERLIATRRIFRRTGRDLVSFDREFKPRHRSVETAEGFAGFVSECMEIRNADGKPLVSFPKALATTWLHNEEEHKKLAEIDLLTLIPVYDLTWNLTPPGLSNGIYYSGNPIEPMKGTAHLDKLLSDFCFHNPADRTNFVGMLLTCVLMPHFSLVEKPGILLNGNQPGIGKSELAQVLATIKQGSDAATATYNPNDEEFEKSLGSLVGNKSSTTIIIDNVKSRKKIESACLERSITDSTLSFRLLKTSERIIVKNSHIFVVTANATEVSTDISSRCTLVGLHYEGDPKARQFNYDSPKRYALEHREQIIAELLGMVDRWLVAGRPMGSDPSRFAVWSQIVGGILACNGEPDFLGNIAELNELDSTQADFADLVRHMFESPTAGSWQSNELVRACEEQELFRSAFHNKTAKGKCTWMGLTAGRFKGVVFDIDGKKIKFDVDKEGRVTRYRVFDVEDSVNYQQRELLVE